MKHKLHFISGLPRAGSTLLANILAQNPRFHATSTSGVLDLISGIRNQWDNIQEFQATPDDDAKARVMSGVFESFYANIDKPVVFDKCRGWTSWIEYLDSVFPDVKILVPVRDMRDVLASYEKLHRKNYLRQTTLQRDEYLQWQSVEGRCAYWLAYNQPIGLAYTRIKDAIQRGHADKLYFVHFEKLTSEPREELTRIHHFLGEEYFEYDFDNVEQVTREDDSVYGMGSLHDIRSKVEPVPSQWKEILGAFADQYKIYNF